MSGSVREALPYVQWLSRGFPGCPGGLSGSPGVFERPSRMSGSCREVLPDVQEWLGGPPGCPIVVGRPSRMSIRDGHPGGHQGCPDDRLLLRPSVTRRRSLTTTVDFHALTSLHGKRRVV